MSPSSEKKKRTVNFLRKKSHNWVFTVLDILGRHCFLSLFFSVYFPSLSFILLFLLKPKCPCHDMLFCSLITLSADKTMRQLKIFEGSLWWLNYEWQGRRISWVGLLFQGISLMKIRNSHSFSQSVSFIFGSGL